MAWYAGSGGGEWVGSFASNGRVLGLGGYDACSDRLLQTQSTAATTLTTSFTRAAGARHLGDAYVCS